MAFLPRRKLKLELHYLLEHNRREELLRWVAEDVRTLQIFSSLLFSPDELIRWRTVEIIGLSAASLEIEAVREMIRRLIWAMNDESGEIIWNAPEVISEILINVPELIDEYARILASSMRLSPFERGVHFAMERISEVDPVPFKDCIEDLKESLEHDDHYIKTYSILILLRFLTPDQIPCISMLLHNRDKIRRYNSETATLEVSTVGQLISEALEQNGASFENSGSGIQVKFAEGPQPEAEEVYLRCI